ncbi:HPP family protein [Hyphomicrobium sp.]|uniref:HPP family protein n=1 Tax=Hyphomicrobium sp. TaxID=82 RepID=UPI002E37AA27|nr:HPP family protein [Hyphomicrobium sp.]HEX2842850.1 HPP family protein [Hyphomicrobium sp.]
MSDRRRRALLDGTIIPGLRELREHPWLTAAAAGIGGGLTIAGLAALTTLGHLALLIPPFGASCVLVFALPGSPLAQPRNVIGGHFVAAAAGLLAYVILGPGVAAAGIGVGLAIAAMIVTRTVHPPAGADPLVVLALQATPMFLLTPVLVGSAIIVVAALSYHRLVTGHTYPART